MIDTYLFNAPWATNLEYTTQIVDHILERFPVKIERYGWCEPFKTKCTVDSNDLIARSICQYPHYNKGDVFLAGKGKTVIHLDHDVRRITRSYISQKFTTQDEIQDHFNFLNGFLPLFQPLYGGLIPFNTVKTFDDEISDHYILGNPYKPHLLTSIYPINFISYKLAQELNIQKLTVYENVAIDEIPNYGWWVKFVNSPLEFDEKIHEQCMQMKNTLGSKHYILPEKETKIGLPIMNSLSDQLKN